MIVGVVPVGIGVIAVNNQFFKAPTLTDGVDQYVNGYTPPKDPADFLGFNTGWATAVQRPAPGKQWAYDRTLIGLVEIDVDLPTVYTSSDYCPRTGTTTENLPRASTATGAVIVSYTNATPELTIGRALASDTINGVAANRSGLRTGIYFAVPSSLTNWELYGPLPKEGITPTVTISAPATLVTGIAYICDTRAGGSFDVQLLPAAAVHGPILVKNIGPNVLGIVPDGTEKIDNEPKLELVNIYDAVNLYPNGVDKWWVW